MKTSALRMATPFVSFIMSIVGGGLLGAITNGINGRVSPLYFQNIMRWHDVSNIPRAAIAQGIFEGLICGLIFGTIFVLAVSIISKLRLGIAHSLSYLGFLFGSAFLAWCLGGLLAIILAWISPDFYTRAFIGVPEDFTGMLRYAWVGGSIWGVQFGGFALLIIWIAVFGIKWKANKAVDSTATRVTPPAEQEPRHGQP
ncbi:MAG: hypothetical protein JZU65_14625 [Chlorobium sp.]|nr:hypothetical protein [Chlorobium sp.]